jgi:hypothetical protein
MICRRCGERAKLLLDASEYEGLFGRCQTFSLPAPTKMLQPRLDHCFSSRSTVVAGLVADIWGPAAGGLFLAFPAIFCASATLIEKHERERKEKKGLRGKERGKDAAALDAAGAGLGGIALAVFGAVIWFLASHTAAGSLALATIAWFVVSILLWRVRRTIRVYGA